MPENVLHVKETQPGAFATRFARFWAYIRTSLFWMVVIAFTLRVVGRWDASPAPSLLVKGSAIPSMPSPGPRHGNPLYIHISLLVSSKFSGSIQRRPRSSC